MDKLKICPWVLLPILLWMALSPTALGQADQDFRLSDLRLDFTLFGASVGSGARALGMGGAFIAIADDGTAASWNPAGLGVLEEAELSVNWQPFYEETLTKPTTRVVAALPVVGESPVFGDTGETLLNRSTQSVDFFGLAIPTRIADRKLVPQFSFQRVVPALNASFEASPGEFINACGVDCRERRVIESSAFLEARGGIDVYAASVGFDLGEKVLLGASLNWWRGDIRTRIEDTSTEVSSGLDSPEDNGVETETRFFNTLEGVETLSGFNFSVGTVLRLTRWAHIGAVFKSPFEMRREFEESLKASELSGNPGEPANSYRAKFSESTTTADGNIDWPATLGIGFACFPTDVATISTDFTWSNWSEARIVEEVTSSGPDEEPITQNIESSYPAPNQVDAWQYRLGGELVIVRPPFAKLMAIPLRGGFFLDRQYFLDFQGNKSLNRGVSAGFGVVWRRLTLDVAYVHAFSLREPAARLQELPLGVVPGTDGTFGGYRQEGGKAHYTSHQVLLSAIVRF